LSTARLKQENQIRNITKTIQINFLFWVDSQPTVCPPRKMKVFGNWTLIGKNQSESYCKTHLIKMLNVHKYEEVKAAS